MISFSEMSRVSEMSRDVVVSILRQLALCDKHEACTVRATTTWLHRDVVIEQVWKQFRFDQLWIDGRIRQYHFDHLVTATTTECHCAVLTLDRPKNYTFCSDIHGAIVIASSDVSLDLNGFCLYPLYTPAHPDGIY